MLKLMYITNDPRIARIAVDTGVDRIFVDMEVMGKAERQGHMDSVKCFHTFDDIRRVKASVGSDGEVLARINPFYEGTQYEVDHAIESGADIIMLPMWKKAEEVERFVGFVGGRAKTMALLETKEADAALEEVLKIDGLDEIHIGLNDLHLSYGLHFMFELLSDGTVDRICAAIRPSGKRYGFGGVGRPGEGMLPAVYILAEHHRLGSGIVILSRSFCNIAQVTDYDEIEARFRKSVADIRLLERAYATWSEESLFENHLRVQQCVKEIVQGSLVR